MHNFRRTVFPRELGPGGTVFPKEIRSPGPKIGPDRNAYDTGMGENDSERSVPEGMHLEHLVKLDACSWTTVSPEVI